MTGALKQFWTRSIRRQLMQGIAVVHAVLMSIFVLDLVERQRDFLHEQAVSSTLGLAHTLATNSASWILADDVIGLEEVLHAQSGFPDLLYVMVLSPRGRVLGHGDPSKVGLYVSDPISTSLLDAQPEPQRLIIDAGIIDIAAPVIANDRLIGWARVGISKERINAGLRVITRDGAWYTLFAIAVGSIFALFMARGITMDLGRLADLAQRIGQGDETSRAAIDRVDELGQLGRGLNHMLDSLIDQKNLTERARGELEQALGEQRLAGEQLEALNRRLQVEVERRRLAEDFLAAEKEQLAVTLFSIADGVITTDMEGRVILVNRVAARLTGWSEEEARGRPLAEVFQVLHKDEERGCEIPLEHMLARGRIALAGEDLLLLARDGARHAINESTAPIRDSRDQVIGVALVFHDTTEEHRMREQVFKARKLESVGVLAGGIAHDFNNILTGILGNISLAKNNVEADGEVRSLLDSAEKASFRAKDLTQQLLTFSKGGDPVRRAASLVSVAHETAAHLLAGSTVRCEINAPPDLAVVYMDPGQISQVIQNMVLNAVHAMPDGGTIAISMDNRRKEPDDGLPLPPGDYVRMTIRDSGIGIPPEHLGRIFDPYFSTKQRGNGLGLAICHSIILKHEGHVSVESRPGEGTVFTVHLPAAKEPPPRPAAPLTVLDPGHGTILIMDDDAVVRRVAGRILAKMGYEVVEAEDGEEALRLYDTARKGVSPIDLVIMDLTIPGGMGGCEAIARLLEMDPKAKAIVSSGYSNDPVVAHYVQHGFLGVVNKPYELRTMVGEVRRVLAMRQSEPPSDEPAAMSKDE